MDGGRAADAGGNGDRRALDLSWSGKYPWAKGGRSVLLVLGLCVLLPGWGSCQAPSASPASLLAETEFVFQGSWIVVPVTVEGETGPWILDSGASTSVLDSTYASTLDLEWGDPIRITGATGTTMVPSIALPPLEVAGLTFRGNRSVALDLQSVVRHRLGTEVRGILGQDFLREYVTRIDYSAKTVSFHNPNQFEYAGGGSVFQESLSGGLFRVPITVDGLYEGAWAVDTGAGSLSFHYPFAEANGLTELPGARFLGHDAAGPSERNTVRFSTIDIAGVTFPDPLIDVPLSAAGAFGRPAFDGNAGNYLFRYFVLYLDYRNERLILEPGADCCEKVPDLVHGLSLSVSESGLLRVRDVLPGSCAEEAGFLLGDEVLGLDGMAVRGGEGLREFREGLRKGQKVEVSIRRGGVRMTRVLSLVDFFEMNR